MRIGPELRLIVRDSTADGARLMAPGEPVTVYWNAGAERVFDAGGAPLPCQPATTPARITSHA